MSAVIPVEDVADLLRGVMVLGEARLGVDDQGRPTMTVPYGSERVPTTLVIDSEESGGYLLGGFRVVRRDLEARPSIQAVHVVVGVLERLARVHARARAAEGAPEA